VPKHLVHSPTNILSHPPKHGHLPLRCCVVCYQVHAFDPSPVSVAWWKSYQVNPTSKTKKRDARASALRNNTWPDLPPTFVSCPSVRYQSNAIELRALPNYHFHGYGAGGKDGTVALYDYNWGQVRVHSYVNAPSSSSLLCVTAYPPLTHRVPITPHGHCHCYCYYR